MCKVADAAKVMVNHSIDMALKEDNSNYYTDFYKLHKLLYYAQGYMLAHYKIHLFEEPIEAHSCGPFIPALLKLPISGYGAITEKFKAEEMFPLTDNRVAAIDYTLKWYGFYSKDKLANMSKKSQPYIQCFSGDSKKEISLNTLEIYKGEFDLFKDDEK